MKKLPLTMIKIPENAVQWHVALLGNVAPRRNRRSIVRPINSPEFGRGQFNCLDFIAFGRTSTARNKKRRPALKIFPRGRTGSGTVWSLCEIIEPETAVSKTLWRRYVCQNVAESSDFLEEQSARERINVSLERFGRLRKKSFQKILENVLNEAK